MNFKDCTGRTLSVGDVILYTMSTDGSAASMCAGRITKFLPKSIRVQPVDPVEFKPKQRETYYMQDTGEFEVWHAGTTYERKYPKREKIVTGVEDVEEQLIPKPEPYRFYLLEGV